MINIIHGDDTVSSRNYFLEQKGKIKNSFSFDGKTLELSQLVQLFEGGNLFDEVKAIFIENLFERKGGAEFDRIVSYLSEHSDRPDVFLWEVKEIDKRRIGIIQNTKSVPFLLPRDLFRFLETLQPDNTQSTQLFNSTVATVEPELIFYMIVRQFRMLLALSDNKSEQIDELKRLAPWQLTKLKKQKEHFSDEKLKMILRRLFNIDLATKTGATPLSLSQSIDFFLLTL